jgi:hypothetical protein
MQLGKIQVAFLHVEAPAINAVATFHASTLIAGADFLCNEMHYIINRNIIRSIVIIFKLD